MKYSIFFVFLSLNFCGFAQLKPIYFVGDNIVSDSTIATSYGVFGKLSGEDLYVLKTFDLSNNLKFSGSYKDADLKTPDGDFVYYEGVEEFNDLNGTYYFLPGKTRFISRKGSYVDGYQNGRWINFYPDGKIMAVVTYVKGIKHGFFGTYNKRGKPMISGAFKLDQKDGEWIHGKVKEVYVDGILQQPTKKKSKNGTKNDTH